LLTAGSGLAVNLDCLGSDRLERSYQLRFVSLSIVPGHVKERKAILPDN